MEDAVIVHGWYDQPNRRGTFDIIKTCGGTIFLLCWSSVCPNVPTSGSGFWMKFANRLQMFLLAVLGPDFIFMTALGQLNTAWRGRKAWHESGYKDWTLRHCFFADMGGVHLDFRDRKRADLPSFPVDSEQLLYLVRHTYLPLPDISEEDINDRNRADELARIIAIVQALWFTLSTLSRTVEGLYITTLELTTLAFVFQMTCSSVCWWCKPMDISRPMTIYVDTDLAIVLQQANVPQTTYGQTPLSFLNRDEGFLSRLWSLVMQIARRLLHLPSRDRSAQADHFRSVEFPKTTVIFDFALGWTIPVYSAMFMAAWRFTFPSLVERTLWRVAAVYNLSFGCVGCAIAFYYDHQARISSQYHSVMNRSHSTGSHSSQARSETVRSGHASGWRHAVLDCLTNLRSQWRFSRLQDPDPTLALPFRVVWLTIALAAVYCLARLYILIEDVIGLRSLPDSAFQTIRWGKYSPIL